ncbi:MAG: NAD-dependent epimerase/dehydratase family protein [Acidimicrobiales bacterium]
MRILVTGATSALGAATARRLSEAGHEVTVFQRSASGLDLAEIRGDIGDVAAVRAAARGHDQIVHLAARVAVTGPREEFERVNIAGTGNVLDAARAAGAGSVVHVSTPSVAHSGTPLVGAPAAPADPSGARGDYAVTKATAEIAALAASTADLAVVAIRPHLVWGPGDTQLVGRIVERARAGRLALVGSGLALIDTTYLDNAADALVAASTKATSLGGRALVVSNGEPRTVGEIVARILGAAGEPPPSLHVPRAVAVGVGAVAERAWRALDRTDDPPMTSFLAEQLSTAHWFDQRETRSALGWTPAVGLDEGFARLAASFADQPA